MGCGCQDKDVDKPRVPEALERLMDLYLKHKKNLKEANAISQAKIRDFDNPLTLGTAVKMAREYKTLLDNLAYVTSKVIAEVYADKAETSARLNTLQSMASQTNPVNNSQGKSVTKPVKKGKK